MQFMKQCGPSGDCTYQLKKNIYVLLLLEEVIHIFQLGQFDL